MTRGSRRYTFPPLSTPPPLPQLVSGPGVLPLFLAGPFDIPLGGQSAVEDLMESFGFEAELGPAQVPHLPSGSRAKEGKRLIIRRLSIS